jgi:hypothetical protein
LWEVRSFTGSVTINVPVLSDQSLERSRLVTYLDPDDSDENERRAAAELADPAALSGPAQAAEGR